MAVEVAVEFNGAETHGWQLTQFDGDSLATVACNRRECDWLN